MGQFLSLRVSTVVVQVFLCLSLSLSFEMIEVILSPSDRYMQTNMKDPVP